MHWCKLILLCIAFITTVLGSKVVLTQDKTQVVPDERVTFTCEVHDMVTGQFLRWQRIVEGLEPINLSTNRYLERDFLDDRFSTTGPSDQASDPLIFSFTINKVTLGDSGGYRCSVLGGEGPEFDEKQLTVVRDVSVDTLSLSHTMGGSTTEITNGDEFKLKVGDSLSVLCITSDVFPPPTLSIEIGGKEVGTNVKPREAKFTKVTDAAKGQLEKWVTVRKAFTTTILKEYRDKELSCTASIPGREHQARKGFFIRLDNVPPTLTCATNVTGSEWDSDVKIICNVTSQPRIIDFKVAFYNDGMSDAGNRRVLDIGEVDDDYKIEIKRNESQVVMTIYRAFLQHFRTYTFIVTNAAGTTSSNVTFIQDPEQNTSNAPGFTGSPISIVIGLMSTMKVIHMFRF